MSSPVQTALVITVPEAEPLVKPFRDLYDTSAPDGMPAHITILYPFKLPEDLTASVLNKLRACLDQTAGFTAHMREARMFGSVPTLYLAPEPGRRFRALTATLHCLFPENPPYGGLYKDVIPHLTVAQAPDQYQLDSIAGDFATKAATFLPINFTVTEVSLWNLASGRWAAFARFPLQGPAHRA